MKALLLLAVFPFLMIACKKPAPTTGHCHVVCVSVYPGFQLFQMDSAMTDTLYYKAFVGDGDFSTPVYTRQLNGAELEKLRMYPDSSYEVDIPAIGKEYRIKNIRINVKEYDYVGHRCDPTICKSYPERPIVNGDSAELSYGQYNVFVLLRK